MENEYVKIIKNYTYEQFDKILEKINYYKN